jgi:hypothetical protein
MDRLHELVGFEDSVTGVTQALHLAAVAEGPPVVGAMHVSCADESENECVTAFQHGFVQHLLPPLKFAQRSAFRIANLGGRYEWGGVRIAEEHYAAAEGGGDHKLMVVKINSHVGIEHDREGYRFGVLKRYDGHSPCCGALCGLLEGKHTPAIGRLGEVLRSEGKDRVATLLDERAVDPANRSLFAAIVSARLQARKIVLDIQDYAPASPTRWLVVPCATINRPERDTEIVCGIYSTKDPGQPREVEYFGLGDDPAAYQLTRKNDRFSISDEHLGTVRLARDHRALVLQQWQHRMGARPVEVNARDERLEHIRRDVTDGKHRHHVHSHVLLQLLLVTLAEIAPVPAAVLLFANGFAAIHHAFRVHHVAREVEASDDARQILKEIHDRVDRLPPERATAIIEMLMKELHTASPPHP